LLEKVRKKSFFYLNYDNVTPVFKKGDSA